MIWPPPFPGINRNANRPGKSVLSGVPKSLLDMLTRPVTFDDLDGSTTASRTASQLVQSVSGGGSISPNSAPDDGDTETWGQYSFSATADPATPAGAGLALANDGGKSLFGAARPRLVAVRMRNDSASAPAAATYELSPCDLARRTSPIIPPAEGVEIVFDPTIGVEGYILRSWVSSSAEDDTKILLAHDSAYHVLGFLVVGAKIYGFADGVIKSVFEPTVIQPQIASTIHVATGYTIANGGVSPAWKLDWVARS